MDTHRKAWLVGGGIGSMAAAAFMIRDGGMAGADISIREAAPVMGGRPHPSHSPRSTLYRTSVASPVALADRLVGAEANPRLELGDERCVVELSGVAGHHVLQHMLHPARLGQQHDRTPSPLPACLREQAERQVGGRTGDSSNVLQRTDATASGV